MSHVVVLLFPHTLFDLLKHASELHEDTQKMLRSASSIEIHVCMDPCFVYDATWRPLRVHKLKIAFMHATVFAFCARVSSTTYKSNLRRALKTQARIAIKKEPFLMDQTDGLYKALKMKMKKSDPASPMRLATWPLTDHTLQAKLRFLLGVDPEELRLRCRQEDTPINPMFVLPEAVAREHVRKGARHVSFAQFYKRACLPALEAFDPVPSTPCLRVLQTSKDLFNREPLPASMDHPRIGTARPGGDYYSEEALPAAVVDRRTPALRAIIASAIAFAGSFGSGFSGTPETLADLAITHEEADAAMKAFVARRLAKYGPYQDALHPTKALLFHSNLAYLLNVGLLEPRTVLDEVLARSNCRRISGNSLEGFVRQLLGWREYMRAVYLTHGPELLDLFARAKDAYLDSAALVFASRNFKNKTLDGAVGDLARSLGATRKLPRGWYDGNTSVTILDDEIRKTLKHGWAHHTVRLMVFLNLLLLIGARPRDMYAWFMEMVSMDAYEWVMLSNIAAMSYMAVGPHQTRFMRKPYWCSSNYAVTMSGRRYVRDKKWDALFHAHLRRMFQAGLLDAGGFSIYIRNLRNDKKVKLAKANQRFK